MYRSLRHCYLPFLPCSVTVVIVLLLAVTGVAWAVEWTGEIDGIGPDHAVRIDIGLSDQTQEDVYVTATNTGSQPWGDFHFGIFDSQGGQDISNIHFLDASLGGTDPTSSQTPLSWVIDNEVVGAVIDLYFYGDPVMPGETAWFMVQIDNPDHISLYGILFYPTSIPTRACCFASGMCEVLPADQCILAGGQVSTEPDCEPNPCPQPPPEFACCLPYDESCYMMTAEDCDAAGGAWYVDALCTWAGGDLDCPRWRVCCIGIECRITTEEACAMAAGIWYPEWAECSPDICQTTPPDLRSWSELKSLYR